MSPEAEYQRYEYEFISEPSLVLFGGKLNRFATDGWRLVATAMEPPTRMNPGGPSRLDPGPGYFIGIVEREVQ